MAAKKIQPRRPGASARTRGSKAQSKVAGRKTMAAGTKHRKTIALKHGS